MFRENGMQSVGERSGAMIDSEGFAWCGWKVLRRYGMLACWNVEAVTFVCQNRLISKRFETRNKEGYLDPEHRGFHVPKILEWGEEVIPVHDKMSMR